MFCAAVLCGGLLALGGSAPGLTATLSPPRDDPGPGPYRRADLTIVHDPGLPAVDTLLLSPETGGPAVRFRLTVPPGQTARAGVLLPALWPVQQYLVTALDRAGGTVGRAAAEITWPADRVSTDAFIDDAFAPWRDTPARWPMAARRGALLAGGLLLAAAAGALMVGRSSLRAAAVLAAAGAAGAATALAPDWPAPVQADAYVLRLHGGPGEPSMTVDSFSVLSVRRSARYVLTARAPPYPVYPDRAAAAGDASEADPSARSLALALRPGAVRVVRPAWTERAEESVTHRESAVAPAGAGPAALVVRDDSAWRVPSGFAPQQRGYAVTRSGLSPQQRGFALTEPGFAPDDLPPGEPVPLGLVLSEMSRRGLDDRAVRLVHYWRQRHQRPGRTYLLDLAPSARTVRLDVFTLSVPAPSATASAARATPADHPERE